MYTYEQLNNKILEGEKRCDSFLKKSFSFTPAFSRPRRALSPDSPEQLLLADRLDPDLRKPDEFTDNYPQYITLTNERFGPFENEGYRNPMEALHA